MDRRRLRSPHDLERDGCREGPPYKRSHLVALRPNKISASDPPSTWWPGRYGRFGTAYPDTDRSEDVSHAVAQEVLRRLGLEGRDVPSELEDFIDCYAGRDRQLTLRLALT
jgi:hypothetical protein